MKKLTAGIFTVLMGLVSVNAADAAVASQGYVDFKVGENADAIALKADASTVTALDAAYKAADASLQQNINNKVDQTAYDAKIQSLESADQGFDARLETVELLSGDGESAAATKTELNTVKDSIGTVETGKTVVSMIGENTTAINGITTSGYATSGITKGKVDAYDAHVADEDIHVTEAQKTAWTAKQDAIDDLENIRSGAAAGATALQPSALNPYSTTEDMNTAISTAKNEAIAAIPTVDTTFVKTSNNPATSAAISKFVSGELEILGTANTNRDLAINAAQSAAEAAQATANENAEAIEAINNETTGILATAMTEINKKANSADVYTKTQADSAFMTSDEVEDKIEAAVADNGAVKTVVDTAISTLENGAVKDNADAIEAINNETTGILAQAKTYAVGKANAALSASVKYTDDYITALGLQDISRVPAACSDTNAYCTLTTNGSGFAWEVITRADGETPVPAAANVSGVTKPQAPAALTE